MAEVSPPRAAASTSPTIVAPTWILSHPITLLMIMWVIGFGSVAVIRIFGGRARSDGRRGVQSVRLWAMGDGEHGGVREEAAEIGKLARRGGGELNVQPRCWLTEPFNLTSHMMLFLDEDAVIFRVQFLYTSAYDKAAIKCNGREVVTNFEPSSYEGEMLPETDNDAISHDLDLNLRISQPIVNSPTKSDSPMDVQFHFRSSEASDAKKARV